MSDPLIGHILLTLILILISALMTAAVGAVEAQNAAKLKADAEQGDARAKRVLPLVEVPAPFRFSAQVVSALCALLLGAFGTGHYAPAITYVLMRLPALAGHAVLVYTLVVILQALVLTWLYLVLGRLVPRRLAEQRPVQALRICLPFARFFIALLRPLIALASLCARGLLRALGMNGQAESDTVTEEEIRLMLDESEEEGLIESTEGEMIDNIFEFNNIQIYDVMTHRVDVETIDIEDSRDEITELIRRTGFSRFPVYEDNPDHIIGILYVKDFFLRSDQPIRALLKEPIFVPDSMICDDLFHKMQREHTHFAVVTDEYGSFLGIITLEDLLEEIVGNIYDEYDKRREYITPNPDGSWLISGRAELKDVEKALDIDLPEQDDFNTLGGLVLSVTAEIPRDGAQFEVEVAGLHIKVLRVSDRRIEETQVTLLPRDETP